MRPIEKLLQRVIAKRRREFAAKLKYGKYWRQELYPHKYTNSTGAE